jgi:hypothetical protein
MDLLPVYLFFFGIPMLATIPATIFLCRFRVARKRQVSYGTMLAGALSVPVTAIVVVSCLDLGFWSGDFRLGPVDILILFGLIAAMCVLPALVVVVYYQRRSKRDAKPVA